MMEFPITVSLNDTMEFIVDSHGNRAVKFSNPYYARCFASTLEYVCGDKGLEYNRITDKQ